MRCICHPCLMELPYLDEGCPICAQPNPAGQPCGICIMRPPPYQRTIAVCEYAWPIIHCIRQLKFADRLLPAQFLGELLSTKIEADADYQQQKPDLIIPVPLHPERLKQRGYNQALEIARPVAKNNGITLDISGVIRCKNTQPQSGLDANSRSKNLRNAFAVQDNYTNCHIAIVDDVITTGATAQALASVLLNHGAQRVDVWAVAKRIQHK